MRDENLKEHCKNVHNASKRIAGERSVENWIRTPAQVIYSGVIFFNFWRIFIDNWRKENARRFDFDWAP